MWSVLSLHESNLPLLSTKTSLQETTGRTVRGGHLGWVDYTLIAGHSTYFGSRCVFAFDLLGPEPEKAASLAEMKKKMTGVVLRDALGPKLMRAWLCSLVHEL